jgi:hypothetical protein
MSRLIPYLILAMATAPLFGQAVNVNISGIVSDSAGTLISGATVKLVTTTGVTATTGQDGSFSLKSGSTALQKTDPKTPWAEVLLAEVHEGALFLSLPEKSSVTITAYGLQGEEIARVERNMDAGSHGMELPGAGSGIGFYKVKAGMRETVVKAFAKEGALRGAAVGERNASSNSPLAKQAATAAALYDVIMVSKTGYQNAYVSIANSDSNGVKIKMIKDGGAKFSFFVTSMKVMLELSGNPQGFGGDFRFGETGPGAGLRGADKLCAAIAERSMPGSSVKGWRAFLSVTADAYGKQVNAIDRVGPGPWYDRNGRLVAPTKADLIAVRPQNGDATIQNDLPNENGIPNHRPDPARPADDNHHTLTGSNASGTLQSATATCKDWTTSEGIAANGKPAHGYSWPRSLGGGMGTGASGSNWMTTGNAFGCGRGVQIVETGYGNQNNLTVGEGGGYGGYYCFALNP